ncbi:MAG: two-component regulator propeller domain-containing protein, partial [Anaerolineae bacterium]
MKSRTRMDHRLLLGMLVVLGLACLGALSRPGPAGDQSVAQAGTVWDSGWVDIATGTARVFTHNLAGDPAQFAVDLWQRDNRSDGLGIHHRAYGGMNVAGQRQGVHWQNLTDSNITVVRWLDDVATSQIRLRVWIPDPPLYDSGWVPIQAGQVVTLTHNLGGDVDGYTVGMKFQDTTPDGRGIHQFAFGGLAAGRAFYGAAWQNLTDTTIQVVRSGNDISAQQVRLFITRPDPPDYDSGWVDVAQDETRIITHNLGGNPDRYVVRSSARSTAADGPGINTRAAGGMEVGGQFLGANWQNLTSTGINVFRQPHDIFAGQMRVRIWRPEAPPAGPWQSWTNADYVRCLALQAGVLWAGTEGGAVRWDPIAGSYHKYLAPDGLEDGYVRAITSDASGVTWFGTSDGGLVAYDGATWTAFTTSDGLANSYVYALASQGGLKWVGTGYGLNAFDDGGTPANKSDDAWTTFRTQDGLSNNYVYAIALDGGGRKWLGTNDGLDVLDDQGTPHDKSDDVWATFSEEDGLVYRRVYALVVDQQERVWAGTTNGLSVLDFAGTPFDKSDDTWTTFTSDDGLTDDDVYGLTLDSQGRVWMATYGGGIFVLDHAGTPFDKIDDTWTQFTTSDGLVNNFVYAVLLDEPAGRAWVGSWGYGISRLDYAGTVENKSDDTWTTLTTDDPLPENYVPALLPDGDHVWAGTGGGGLAVTDGETWTTFTAADGLVSNYVYAITARNGLKWVGTSGGLNAFDDAGTPYDSADDTWASFRTDDGLNTNSVYDLEFDEVGRLWMGSNPRWSGSEYVDGGLSVLDDAGTPFDNADDTWMTYVPVDSGGVLNGWGYEIATDDAQRLWAATYPWWTGSEYEGGGLVLLDHAGTPFDKADDTWTVFTTTHGLASDWVYSVAVDDDGRVWAGTSSGLNVLDHAGTPFDKTDDTWVRFRDSDGLAGNAVWGILIDASGRLWLATSGGLSVLDTAGTPFEKSDDGWLTWTVADGLVDSYLYSVALDASG